MVRRLSTRVPLVPVLLKEEKKGEKAVNGGETRIQHVCVFTRYFRVICSVGVGGGYCIMVRITFYNS